MFQTLVTVAFLLTDRYASRASVQLQYDLRLNFITACSAGPCCSLKVSEFMLAPRGRRPLKQNDSKSTFEIYKCSAQCSAQCIAASLNVSVQWYIGHLECTDFGDPRNMPNVPVIPQIGNVLVMYCIVLYRNMYLYRNRPALYITMQQIPKSLT
jgi:hypothetical protein